MKYRAVFTHNPQDFFNGYEDPELSGWFDLYNKYDLENIDMVFNALDNGYKVIIFRTEGDEYD